MEKLYPRQQMEKAVKARIDPPGLGPDPSGGSSMVVEIPKSTLIVAAQPCQKVSAETQTEVHLEHSIKAITWIPVVEQLDPVHDIDGDLAEGILESEKILAEPVNKIFDMDEGIGSVNDVDSVEIFREKLGGAKEEKIVNELEDPYHPVESKLMLIFLYYITTYFIIWWHYFLYIPNILEAKEEKSIELGIYNLDNEPSNGGGGVSNRASKESKSNHIIKSMKLKLKRGITVDSGSHHNVMSKKLVNHKRIRPSVGSKAGLHYVAANRGKYPMKAR